MTELIDATPAWAAIAIGLVALVWGADRFVDGSAAAARNLGVSPLIIGLTIVSIGTSAPEILVAINATLEGKGSLAIGNALGSNLANIGLVLGVTALVAPLPSQWHLIKQEAPILLAVTALAGLLIFDGVLSRFDGALLLGLLIPLMWGTLYLKKRKLNTSEIAEEEHEIPSFGSGKAAALFAVGLATLLLGSDLLVSGATRVAESYGLSELVIGLTIVAIGTSLPELAASVASAVKGHHEIAIGNVFGSNLFNLMAVMSVPGLIAPLQLEPAVFDRDFLAMAAITTLLVVCIWWSLRGRGAEGSGRLGRRFGSALLLLWAGYNYLLFS